MNDYSHVSTMCYICASIFYSFVESVHFGEKIEVCLMIRQFRGSLLDLL